MGDLNFIVANKRKKDILEKMKNRKFDYTEQELRDATSFFDKKEKEVADKIAKKYIKEYGIEEGGTFESEDDIRELSLSDASQQIYDNMRNKYLNNDSDYLKLENAVSDSTVRNVKNVFLGAGVGNGATLALMIKKPKIKKLIKENIGISPYIPATVIGGVGGFGLSRATDIYRKKAHDVLRKIENQALVDNYREEIKNTMNKVAFYKEQINKKAESRLLDGYLEKIAMDDYNFYEDKPSFFNKHKRDIAIGAIGVGLGALGYKNRHSIPGFRGKKVNLGKMGGSLPSWVEVVPEREAEMILNRFGKSGIR